MAVVSTYFSDFLKKIRLTENQIDDLIRGHSTLRSRLEKDSVLSEVLVSTFLQGSYRRATATRPKNGKRSDVDVIVVTNLDKEKCSPKDAHDLFIPFLDEHYKDKYRVQGRSLGIELSYVDLDLVVTSAPSEVQEDLLESDSVLTDYSVDELNDWVLNESWVSPEYRVGSQQLFDSSKESEWKTEPLFIPDRHAEKWDPTDPLAQIKWTWEKNKKTNRHYVNVVKALKWWRKEDDPDSNHPKSYPLEHLVGQACPDEIQSIAEGVTLTLENIVELYPTKPIMYDHGVPEHDVFGRLTENEYNEFYKKVQDASDIARKAFDEPNVKKSVVQWKELFGSKFPDPTSTERSESGFSKRDNKTQIGGSRFA